MELHGIQQMTDFKMTVMSLSLNDLFASLATVYLLVALLGLKATIRRTKFHTAITYICVLLMPLLHVLGIYFITQSVP